MTSHKPKRMKRFFLNKEEKDDRAQALDELNSFFDNMESILYYYRSYLPHRLDYTNVSEGIRHLQEICNSRPDWAVEALKNNSK